MNALRNRVQLIGNLGQDPEIINLESGRKLAKFSLATNETYTNKQGDRVTNTDWHNIVAWGKIAEIVENYLTKGRQVMVVGKINYDQYETKQGEKRYATQITANELLLMGSKPD
ncbi:MAG TPA: single-stranded DNA-binding protein [Flavobacteriaceae bacterium]|nr:single-stranded DNA-binding protein [Flavobacteriaceae bacterium]